MAERNTRQKQAVLGALKESSTPLGVADILSIAREAVPTLSQATVYRILNRLLKKRKIVTVQLPGEAPLYEPAGRGHHHFFRCRRCQSMYEVAGCDELLGRLTPSNFTLEGHDLFLYGLCDSCN